MLANFSRTQPQISNRKDLAQFSAPLARCHFRGMQGIGRCQRREDIVVHFGFSQICTLREPFCGHLFKQKQWLVVLCRLVAPHVGRLN
jgi:hypothetical protein